MSIKLIYLFIINIISIISFGIANVNSQSQCTYNLVCIPIKDCAPIINALNSIKDGKQTITDADRLQLRQLQCGTDPNNGLPYVCCNTTESSSSSLTSPTYADENDEHVFDDFLKHPNINLLPRSTCGPIYQSANIVNNNKNNNSTIANLFEYPWLVILMYKGENGLTFNCGGSLISDHYVLTAAHCIPDRNSTKRLIAVRVGEYDFSTTVDCEQQTLATGENTTKCADPAQEILIDKIIIHNEYNRKKYLNDIALLKLTEAVKINSENVSPVCLPLQSSYKLNRLTRFTVSGWGISEEKQSSVVLRSRIQYLPKSECQQLLNNVIQITDSHICAGGEEGVDTCRGDSGGPLVYSGLNRESQYVQYGIVSIGGGSCSASNSIPGVYTNVFYYMTWILDNLEVISNTDDDDDDY